MKAVKNKEIKKDIYNMLIPMIFESILQTSAGLISTAMLGRLLADDVSAQGLALRISETLWCLYRGIAIGATILIARSIGKNDRNQCKHTTQQTILSAMPIAIISMILLLTFPTQILSFFSKETELLSSYLFKNCYMGISFNCYYVCCYCLLPRTRKHQNPYAFSRIA
ncbi:MAG: MATE family efflux transporter [Oscillospiraceae bacterium]